MAYLEVIIQNGPSGPIALSANGVSLAKDKGCLAFFLPSVYPIAEDYVRGLKYEGWKHYNTATTSTMGMIDGFTFSENQTKLIFTGDGRYQIVWQGDRWIFKDHPRHVSPENLEGVKMHNQFSSSSGENIEETNYPIKNRKIEPEIGIQARENAKLFMQKGLTLLNKDQYKQAITEFNHAIGIGHNSLAYYFRGMAYYFLEQYEQAITDYNHVVEIDTEYASRFYLMRGSAYYALKQYEQAFTNFNLAINIDPSFADPYIMRGDAYHGLGQYEQAISDLECAIEIDPDHAIAHEILRIIHQNIQQKS